MPFVLCWCLSGRRSPVSGEPSTSGGWQGDGRGQTATHHDSHAYPELTSSGSSEEDETGDSVSLATCSTDSVSPLTVCVCVCVCVCVRAFIYNVASAFLLSE